LQSHFISIFPSFPIRDYEQQHTMNTKSEET
jgi:hypothetical protein